MNLLKETIETLNLYEKTPQDIFFVTDGINYCDMDEFMKHANFDYNDGYGSNEINLKLKIVGKDFWLERHEYDGSEWWEHKKQPIKPVNHGIPNIRGY